MVQVIVRYVGMKYCWTVVLYYCSAAPAQPSTTFALLTSSSHYLSLAHFFLTHLSLALVYLLLVHLLLAHLSLALPIIFRCLRVMAISFFTSAFGSSQLCLSRMKKVFSASPSLLIDRQPM